MLMLTTMPRTVAPAVQPREGSADVEVVARWLDINVPGWAQRVDVNTLNLASCNRCILGQVFGFHWNIPSSWLTSAMDRWREDTPYGRGLQRLSGVNRAYGLFSNGGYHDAWVDAVLDRRLKG